MWSSPFITLPSSVSQIMLRVLLALIPGIALYVWYFGPAILVSITLASITALATEAVMLKLRNRPIKPFLTDNSALLTAWLLALSIPPLAPWWMVVVGTAFAIAISKHLYGGLGNNPFNPAMIGYAVLIISFPVHMTHWLTPHALGGTELVFRRTIELHLQRRIARRIDAGCGDHGHTAGHAEDAIASRAVSERYPRHAYLRPSCRQRQRDGGDRFRHRRHLSAVHPHHLLASAGGFSRAHCSPRPASSIWSTRCITSRRCSTGSPVRRC